MQDKLSPEFLTAMGNFRHALEKLNADPAKTRQQQVVAQILGNMLEDAYIKISRAFGGTLSTLLLPDHKVDVRGAYTAVINLDWKQIRVIQEELVRNCTDEATVTLADDGISFQALLHLEEDRVKTIYSSESLQFS